MSSLAKKKGQTDRGKTWRHCDVCRPALIIHPLQQRKINCI